MQSRLHHLRASVPAMTDVLASLVEAESPSNDAGAIAGCAAAIANAAKTVTGLETETISVDGRLHLRIGASHTATVALIGHFDTVWPLGTGDSWPFTVEDGVATGPGAYDMKAGIVQALYAISVLEDVSGVTLLLTSDEELGSQTSRALVETTARGARAALVLEPSGQDGALKVGRKGTSMYEIHVAGRAAHAGLEPEKGANALVELAHQVLSVSELDAPHLGTTVTPTVATSGTATNVVPDTAVLHIDVRATTIAEQERIDRALHAVTAQVAGTAVRVLGAPNRPPMEPDAGIELLARAQRVAGELGLGALTGISVGGGSDGNFTAAIGVPTLDGLGAVGGGAHARDEHVVVSAMAERAALLAGLIEDIRG